MYETHILPHFELPEIDAPGWSPGQTFVAVFWASPLAFRRAGIWARLLANRPWDQVLLNATLEDVDALIPRSRRDRTVVGRGDLGMAPDQVVAVLVVDGNVRLAMQDSPTESAWERFEAEMTAAGLN